MKFLPLICFVLLLSSCSQIHRMEKLQSERWIMTQDSNKIRFTQKDSLTLLCCVLSPIYNDDSTGTKHSYWIEIETVNRIDTHETSKRKLLQNHILDSLDIPRHDKTTYGRYHDFKIRRNTLSYLKIPAGIRKDQSIYIKDALEELGYRNEFFKNVEELQQILEFRKKVFKTLKIKHIRPNWYSEYIVEYPINTDF